jgi:hypothetical protein
MSLLAEALSPTPIEIATVKDHYEPSHQTEFEQPSTTIVKILVTPLTMTMLESIGEWFNSSFDF